MSRKKATIVDIAAALNIAPSTVSKAFSDHPRISQRTKKAVYAKAKELNYRPNFFATALRRGESRLIGVIVPLLENQFFASAVNGMQSVARERGYHILITQSREELVAEQDIISSLSGLQVDGIIVSITTQTDRLDHFEKLIENNFPIVFFDRIGKNLPVSSVRVADFDGAYAAVTHLADQGAERIAHLAGVQTIDIMWDRNAGYRKALADRGLPYREDYCLTCDLSRDAGWRLAEKLWSLPEPPDAIFASADAVALGSMQWLQANHIAIPDQVAIVGFSDEPYSALVRPSLSTVAQSSFQQGVVAMELLLDQLEVTEGFTPGVQKIIPAELIIRQSSNRNLEQDQRKSTFPAAGRTQP